MGNERASQIPGVAQEAIDVDRPSRSHVVLRIFIKRGCLASDRAKRLARDVHQRLPAVRVEFVDVADATMPTPDTVFAVPTYVLDGEVISLGNPRPAALIRRLADRLAAGKGR